MPVNGNAAMFFRAQHAPLYVRVDWGGDAIEPNPDPPYGGGQTGLFYIVAVSLIPLTRDLTVYYRLTGSALNDVDYVTNNGVVTLPASSGSAPVEIQPRPDSLVEFDETVTLTLIRTNTYVIDPTSPSKTLILHDSFTNIFEPVVTNIYHPIAIDYHAPSNSLIVSYNYSQDTPPALNFARIYTNAGGTVVEPWSGIGGLLEEIKLVTIRTNGNGFTNGDVYFSSDTDIGWLSADGTRSNMSWCILTNATFTNPLKLRGSLNMDRTGTFSNNLVVVTSDETYSPGDKGVWLVDSNAHPTLLASIYTRHLEGVVTVTNDVQRWGSWAGKILTGDEAEHVLFAIATNGALTAWATTELLPDGIGPEDYDIIPPDQDLYCVCYQDDGGWIVKVSRSLFTNYVGDLLVTQAGETPGSLESKLFIIHWDSSAGTFATRIIPLPPEIPGHFEHVTFAPITLPTLTP